MSPFSEKAVSAAIARLSSMSTKDVKELRDRAEQRNLSELKRACDAELGVRPFDLTADQAASHEEMARQVEDMDLADAIRHAFSSVQPADEDEIRILQWIAAHPGGSFQAAMESYPKGHLSLVVGHLVYHRFGCFRRFMSSDEDQSSVLLHKDRSGKSVRYTLRPEAERVFRELSII